jgi:hypothetical protein
MKPVKTIMEADGKRKVVIYQNEGKAEFTFVAFEYSELHQTWRPVVRYLAYVDTEEEAVKLAEQGLVVLQHERKRVHEIKKRRGGRRGGCT